MAGFLLTMHSRRPLLAAHLQNAELGEPMTAQQAFRSAARQRRPTGSSHPFEFWPGWLFYSTRCLAQWICARLALRRYEPPDRCQPDHRAGRPVWREQIGADPRHGRALRREALDRALCHAASPAQDDASADPGRSSWTSAGRMVLKPDVGCNGTGRPPGRQDPDGLWKPPSPTFPSGVRLLLQAFMCREPGEAGHVLYPPSGRCRWAGSPR